MADTKVDTKPFWQSKTFWVNVIAIIASITVAFGVDLGLDPETQVAVVGAIMGVINIGLRFVTTKAISSITKSS